MNSHCNNSHCVAHCRVVRGLVALQPWGCGVRDAPMDCRSAWEGSRLHSCWICPAGAFLTCSFVVLTAAGSSCYSQLHHYCRGVLAGWKGCSTASQLQTGGYFPGSAHSFYPQYGHCGCMPSPLSQYPPGASKHPLGDAWLRVPRSVQCSTWCHSAGKMGRAKAVPLSTAAREKGGAVSLL